MKLTTWASMLAALAVACSSDDDAMLSVDSGTQAADASKPEVKKDGGQPTQTDATVVEAATHEDATVDSPAEDASNDAPVVDAAADVPTDTLNSACTTNAECATGEFCDHGDNKKYSPNGQCTLPGVCKVIPTCNPNCITNGDTLCGCDGVTYYCPGCAEASGTNVAWVNSQGLNPCP